MYLYFEKCPSHLGPPETSLVFLGSVCPQLKPGLAAKSSRGEGEGGPDSVLLWGWMLPSSALAEWTLIQVECNWKVLPGFYFSSLLTKSLSVTLALQCLWGAKNALFSVGLCICLLCQAVTMLPCPNLFLLACFGTTVLCYWDFRAPCSRKQLSD